MSSLLSKCNISVRLLKPSKKTFALISPQPETILKLARASYKIDFDKFDALKGETRELHVVTKGESNLKNFDRLSKIQSMICNYFEEESKGILIDLSKMQSKNNTLKLKFVKRDTGSVMECRKINELAKLIRYKIKRLPEYANITKVLLEEDSFK
jgi:hypothetical protein